MSTQVESRIQSARQRRSLLPGPKITTGPVKTTVRCGDLPSPTSPSSGFKHLQIGQEVTTSDGKVGVLRFKGKTHFTQGFLCGIELYDAVGKNDGSVDGIYYFECLDPHGLFVPAYKVFPSGSPDFNSLMTADKTFMTTETKAQKKHQTATVTSKRLPRPKTLPFSEGPLQRDRKLRTSKSTSGQTPCQTAKVSGSAKSKDRPSLSSGKLSNRKVSPLNTSVTCPGWLGKSAPLSQDPDISQQNKKDLNGTFTIPGDGQSNLQSGFSARRKYPNKVKNGYQKCKPVADSVEKPRGRLDSVPSYQDLSGIGGSDEELGTPTRPDIVEDCQSRVNRTYDMTQDDDGAFAPVVSPITFDVGSQGSLGTWEDNSVSCGKSNSSLAWDFDIPAASTPVEFHVKVDRKAQQSVEDEDFISTDDEIEYNEFLAIPTFCDTPTGRCKFDLLTPEELEQALNETNLLPDELRDCHKEEEPLLNLSNIHKTPIWEPITPVEDEFLPFASGSTLDPNPLAFWSMDSVPVKTEVVPEQQEQKTDSEGNSKMEFVKSTATTLENASIQEEGGEGDKLVDRDVIVHRDTNSEDNDLGLLPCDLLQGVHPETVDEDGTLNEVVESPGLAPVMIELVVSDNNPECSDSSSCSNKTVKENISALEELVDNVTDDLKLALKESEIVKEIHNQTFEKESSLEVQEMNRKSLLIKPRIETKTTKKPNATKTETKPSSSKDKAAKVELPKDKPPVPPKLRVIPRRRTMEPGKVGAKLTEVKSRINTGRKSLDANPTVNSNKESVTQKLKAKENTVKDAKVTKRTPLQLPKDKDRIRKQSSSSATSDNSKGGADSKGSVNSSRPSSVKSDGSTDAKRNSKKATNPPPRNIERKPFRSNSLSNQPSAARTSQKPSVTKTEPVPARRTGPANSATRKPVSSLNGPKTNHRILPKDPKPAKIKKLKLPSGASTPPDVVYASIPDVRTNEEIKRLETLCNNQTKQLDAACHQIRVNAKAFETMAVLVQYLTERCDALAVPSLKKKINSLEEQVKETSSHVAGLEREIIRHEHELNENKKYHQQEMLGAKHQVPKEDGHSEVESSSVEGQGEGLSDDTNCNKVETLMDERENLRGEPEGEQQKDSDSSSPKVGSPGQEELDGTAKLDSPRTEYPMDETEDL